MSRTPTPRPRLRTIAAALTAVALVLGAAAPGALGFGPFRVPPPHVPEGVIRPPVHPPPVEESWSLPGGHGSAFSRDDEGLTAPVRPDGTGRDEEERDNPLKDLDPQTPDVPDPLPDLPPPSDGLLEGAASGPQGPVSPAADEGEGGGTPTWALVLIAGGATGVVVAGAWSLARRGRPGT